MVRMRICKEFSQVVRSMAMYTVKGQQTDTLDPLLDWEPVEEVKDCRVVIIFSSSSQDPDTADLYV